MKALYISLLVSMVLCVASGAFGATNSIPYTNSFENVSGALAGGHLTGYTNNESVIDGSLGWYSEIDGAGLVVTQSYEYSGSLPISTSTVSHAQVLNVTGALTNLIDSGASTNVWVDCMIRPMMYDTDRDGYPSLYNDVKSGLFVATNGQINVLARYFTDDFYTEWLALDHTPIEPDQWFRLTIEHQLYDGFTYFQVSVNGVPAGNEHAMMSVGDYESTNGTWWFSPADGVDSLKSLSISGTARLDDLQIVTSSPIGGTTNYTIVASVDGGVGATINPSGNVLVAAGANRSFTISADGGYTVTNVYVSYSGFTGWVGATNAYTMTNVTANGSITVYTLADTITETSNHTPYSYYSNFYDTTGWTDGTYSNYDFGYIDDGDGVPGFEEYLTGTNPNDSNSFFRVLAITYAGSSNEVSFYGTTNYGGPEAWSMYRAVNLTNTWDLITTNINPAVTDPDSDGTNVWWDTGAPGTAPVFYRPSSHVAP